MKTLFSVPNLLSLGNLLCGCIATLNVIEGNLYPAAFLIGLASVFDFLDGFAARGLKQGSPMGKELDSLADMVTFGVVPGMLMFQLIKGVIHVFEAHSRDIQFGEFWTSANANTFSYGWFMNYLPYLAFIIPLFSALRLAKFNVDTRQSESFIGLPTLANAIFISGLPFLFKLNQDEFRVTNIIGWSRDFLPSTYGFRSSYFDFLVSPWWMIGITVVMSFLLISPIPMFSFKIKQVKWKGNEMRYIFLLLSIVLVILFGLKSISLVILLYILLSIVYAVTGKR